jgi:hypothetical protein
LAAWGGEGVVVLGRFLLALEESGPCVLTCPRKVSVAKFLLAREESGPCALACPGGEWSVPFFNLPGKTKPALSLKVCLDPLSEF